MPVTLRMIMAKESTMKNMFELAQLETRLMSDLITATLCHNHKRHY